MSVHFGRVTYNPGSLSVDSKISEVSIPGESKLIEGKKAIVLNVSLLSSKTQSFDIGKGIQKYTCLKGIHIANPDPAQTIQVNVQSTGQMIPVLPGQTVYAELIAGCPETFVFSTATLLTVPVLAIITNYDLAPFAL